jgi:hypothetical protein
MSTVSSRGFEMCEYRWATEEAKVEMSSVRQ